VAAWGFWGRKAKHPTYQIKELGAPLSKIKKAALGKPVPPTFND
jgi:hypothetical protein